MNNLLVKILGVCFLVVGVLCLVKSSRAYLMDNWSNIIWTAMAAFLATLLGVYLAFQADSYRQEQTEKEIFQYKLVTVLFETSQNLRIIKDIRSSFTQTGVNIKQLNYEIAKQLLADPLTMKHGAQGLFYATSVMIDAIDTFNRNSEFVTGQFNLSGKNSDKNLELIQGSLDQAEYRIRILQKVLDFYNVEKFKTILWKEPNYDQIWGWIKGNIDFKKEVEKLRQEEIEKQKIKK